MAQFESLFARERGEPVPLPSAIRERYGALSFPIPPAPPYVVANFVSTIDGVVSYGVRGAASARAISRANDDDRFLMGLLRATADAIVVGAGTLRAERAASFQAEAIHPGSADAYAQMRREMGKPPHPVTFFVTDSGNIDAAHPVFGGGTDVRILTSAAGAEHLRTAECRAPVRVAGEGAPSVDAILEAVVTETGAAHVLCEGGPNLFGRFLAARRIDEIFLTIAPQIAGRSKELPRRALVEETAFAPEAAPWGDTVSVKRAGDFLFLRYAFPRA